jgi:hypothetical protein
VDYDVILRIIIHLKLQKTPFNRIKKVKSFQPHWSKLAKIHVTHCPLTIACNKYMFTNIIIIIIIIIIINVTVTAAHNTPQLYRVFASIWTDKFKIIREDPVQLC